MTKQNIGLSELIEKVKTDLLTPPKEKTAPFLFVDSVELELQVVVKKEGEAGIEVDVIGFGGANFGGNVGKEQVQTVKITLSPLFTKEEIKEYYKALRFMLLVLVLTINQANYHFLKVVGIIVLRLFES